MTTEEAPKETTKPKKTEVETFLLIRHATNDAVGKRLVGRMAGVHLNSEGKSQVQKLVKQLEDVHIDAIYSSPLERAVETAEPVAKSHKLELLTSVDVIELDYGDWTNVELKALKHDEHFARWNRYRSGTRIPGGETMLSAQVRLLSTIETLCKQHPNQTVAIVSHADVIKAGIAYWTGLSLDMIERIEVGPASVTVVRVGVDWVKVLTVNSLPTIASVISPE